VTIDANAAERFFVTQHVVLAQADIAEIRCKHHEAAAIDRIKSPGGDISSRVLATQGKLAEIAFEADKSIAAEQAGRRRRIAVVADRAIDTRTVFHLQAGFKGK
jgi:hypothetical protein